MPENPVIKPHGGTLNTSEVKQNYFPGKLLLSFKCLVTNGLGQVVMGHHDAADMMRTPQ